MNFENTRFKSSYIVNSSASYQYLRVVLNQIVSRSVFYVEVQSDWCTVVINDISIFKNCHIQLSLEMVCQSVEVREILIYVRELSGKCQGILYPPECGNPAVRLSQG